MSTRSVAGVIAAVASLSVAAGLGAQRMPGVDPSFTGPFTFDSGELASTGRNPYFVLEPGYAQVLEGNGGRLVITVLQETKVVDGVETRIVEERETDKDQLVEVSRNYFAISRRTNSIYYFGEDVDSYKGGKVTNHDGSWLAGVKGAKAGLWLPGEPLLRARYYQEIAPGVAMDRGEVVSVTERMTVPAGTFADVVKIEETTPLEPGTREFKYFARGAGLLVDGDLKLVRFGPGMK